MKLHGTALVRFAVVLLFILYGMVSAFACASGPDSYRVIDVAANDFLNVRSGPGTKFGIVGRLPPFATDLENLDQVPIACDDVSHLNDFERNNYWTKIYWNKDDKKVIGWVKTRFLEEN